MVGFKKDHNDNKPKLLDGVRKYLSPFISGFIIAIFLVFFITLMVLNLYSKNLVPPTPSSSEEPSSSEPLSSEEPSSSIISSSSETYQNEQKIVEHLLDITQDYDDTIEVIHNISVDEEYLYLLASSNDHYLYIYSVELGTRSRDELLETLITATSGIEVADVVNTFMIEELPSIDVTTQEAFKNDTDYQGYTYKNKFNYYPTTDTSLIGVSAVGYKEGGYISLIHVRYDVSTSSMINTPIKGYNSLEDDTSSEYYRLLSYFYTK